MRIIEKESIIKALFTIKRAIAEVNKDYGMNGTIVDAVVEASDGLLNEFLKYPKKSLEVWNKEILLTSINIDQIISEKAIEILKRKDIGINKTNIIDVISKNVSLYFISSSVMIIAIVVDISNSLIPALELLLDALQKKMEVVKDIPKLGKQFSAGKDPVLLGEEFIDHISQIKSVIKYIMKFLSKINYLEKDKINSDIQQSEEFNRKLINKISELTGLFFEASTAELSEIICNAMVEISGCTRVINNILQKISINMRYFLPIPKFTLDEPILEDIQPGKIVIQNNLIPSHREIILILQLDLIKNNTTIMLANNNCQWDQFTFMPIITRNLLCSLQLSIDSVIFISQELTRE